LLRVRDPLCQLLLLRQRPPHLAPRRLRRLRDRLLRAGVAGLEASVRVEVERELAEGVGARLGAGEYPLGADGPGEVAGERVGVRDPGGEREIRLLHELGVPRPGVERAGEVTLRLCAKRGLAGVELLDSRS